MFVKIAARAAESEESYTEAANSAEQLAHNVEKCLKIRVDPDLGSSSGPEVVGLNIDSSRISKHNEGLAEPKGIKVKEKDVRGSRRPIGGLEKAKSKKKKKKNTENAQLQPHGASMGHSEALTNQIPTYKFQYNPILNAPMQPSVGAIPMSTQNQRLFAELQPYNTLMGQGAPGVYHPNGFQTYNTLMGEGTIGVYHPNELHSYNALMGQSDPGVPTNQNYTYLQPTPFNSALHPSMRPTIGTSSASTMTGQNQAYFHQPKPN